MATPTAARSTRPTPTSSPGTRPSPIRNRRQIFGLDSGPNGTQCPGQIRPFNPRLVAGTSNPVAGAFCSFTLKLDRDDGDQFLGDLNFTMPPGLHRRPARHHLLPGGGDRRGRPEPRAHRAGAPELPGLQPDRHHQRRRRPRLPPLPRGRARCTWRAPSRARRSRWSRSPRPWPVPMTTAPSSSGSPSTSTRSTPT